jgi:hypothetical protein
VCRFRNSTLFLFFISLGLANAQIKQIVSGEISDGLGKPLASANIQLIGPDSAFLAVSAQDGKFSVSVTPGRYWIKATFTGYRAFEEELLVIAGKSNYLKVSLTESPTQLTDVEVSSGLASEIPGSYSISIEKTMRVPANFFDPVRMATSLPGVVGTNDQGNSVSVKGYSPNAMLWRLQGLDIVNPNHLANAGTLSDRPVANGGGVSILSSQVLDRTNFYSGTLPVQYGNALSGVMDMSLRPGSKTSREHTVQASLIGIDLATEGPMGKIGTDASDASYLVNYRYSTVGLLSQLGVNFGDEVINFQDLTFNLDFDHKKGGNLSVFGFGGLSSNKFERKPQDEWETEKDRYNIDFTGRVFGTGFTNTDPVGNHAVLKTGLAVSGQYQERKSASETISDPHVASELFQSNRTLVSALIDFKTIKSSRFSWNVGAISTSYWNEMNSETVWTNPPPDQSNLYGVFNTTLIQVYYNTDWRLGNKWSLTSGVRMVYPTQKREGAIEPRIVVNRIMRHGSLYLSYGSTSQLNQPQTNISSSDFIGLNYARQVTLGYSQMLNSGVRLMGQAYFHYLWRVPVTLSNAPQQYSTMNQFEDWPVSVLWPNGKGRNYGVESTLEKKFMNKLYFLVSGSWYKSEFRLEEGSYQPTRFNGNFTSSLNGGKEWSKRNKTFGIHTRVLYLGGLRQPFIDPIQSQTYGTTVYSNSNEFAVKLPNYFRIDLRASWRKNKPGYTRTISIDIQNLTAQQNLAYRYFDTYTQRVEKKNQLGLIPVLVYRIDF